MRQENFRCFFSVVLGENVAKDGKISCLSITSPDAMRAITLIGLNHSLIKSHWSISVRRFFAVLFWRCFSGKHCKKVQKFILFDICFTVYAWKSLIGFFTRQFNLKKPVENIDDQGKVPIFLRYLIGAKYCPI